MSVSPSRTLSFPHSISATVSTGVKWQRVCGNENMTNSATAAPYTSAACVASTTASTELYSRVYPTTKLIAKLPSTSNSICRNTIYIKMAFRLLSWALLVWSADAFVAFSLLVPANRTACFRDFYPEKESIAVHFQLQDFPVGSLRPELVTYFASHPLASLVSHRFTDGRGRLLGELQASELDVFTHTTVGREVLVVCASNAAPADVVVSYNLTVNVLNNDHERLPDKDHLRLYQAELRRVEALTAEMSSNNAQVLTRARARQFSADALFDSAGRLAFAALAFILGLRALQLCYLRAKLRSKKML